MNAPPLEFSPLPCGNLPTSQKYKNIPYNRHILIHPYSRGSRVTLEAYESLPDKLEFMEHLLGR